MELGEKLKAARLEAGLSQRQLCADTITRNMLSQIENGSAKPSYATMQALCARLGKPVRYFMEDAPSENLPLLHQASSCPPEQAAQLLRQYLAPDPLLDGWYSFLYVRCRLALAKQALQEQRTVLACALLKEAQTHCTGEVEDLLGSELFILLAQAGAEDASVLSQQLPDNTPSQLLKARGALARGDGQKCLGYLDGADCAPEESFLLRGQALILLRKFHEATACLHAIEDALSDEVFPLLELCYREMGNFEKAYLYACKQR